VKALVVGLGSAGQRHVRNLKTLRGNAVEILTCRSRGLDIVIDAKLNASFGRRPEDEYRLVNYPSLDAALAQRPDLVVVANPISLHLPVARAALDAGCHVFIEKPLADRWEGVQELIDLARRRKRVVGVGYQMRFHEGLRRLRATLEEGRIGAVVSAHFHFGEYLPGMHPYEDYRESHASRSDQGGGVVRALSHELDTAQWLFGMPRRVYAAGGHLSGLEVDVEDVATILLHCEAQGRLLPVSVYLDFVQRPTRRFCEIVGENGTLLWDYVESSIAHYDPRAKAWQTESLSFDRNRMFLDEMENMLRAMEGREPLAVPVEAGADTLRVALAALRSIETGQPCELI
jgi:predicted dehydrogenase